MNTRTRIKFCGITSVEDASLAVQAGADAIGLVFYEPSPRYIDLIKARLIADSVPAFVTVVGLFVNATAETVRQTLQTVRLDLLQFHGDEEAAFCESFRKPYMKALRIQSGSDGAGGLDIVAEMQKHPNASAILLDAWHPELPGGSGQTIDWNDLSDNNLVKDKLVLAGGLDPDNVAEAIVTVKPYAVDVSSGIETAPGLKSSELMQKFFAAVKQCSP